MCHLLGIHGPGFNHQPLLPSQFQCRSSKGGNTGIFLHSNLQFHLLGLGHLQMGQQRVGRITTHLLALSRNHQFSLGIQSLLIQILVQDIRGNQCLLKDQINQLGFVIRRDIRSNVLSHYPLSQEVLVLIREGLGIGIDVGTSHQLMADVLHCIDIVLNLEAPIGHNPCVTHQVIPISLIQLRFSKGLVDLINQFLIH